MRRPTTYTECTYTDELTPDAIDRLIRGWRLADQDLLDEVTAAHRHLFVAFSTAAETRPGSRLAEQLRNVTLLSSAIMSNWETLGGETTADDPPTCDECGWEDRGPHSSEYGRHKPNCSKRKVRDY